MSKQPTSTVAHLAQALALTPAGAGEVDFTDWALIRQYLGFPDVNSKSSQKRRSQYIKALFDNKQAEASNYDMASLVFASPADIWSWDSTDLLWEASIRPSKGLDALVLKFPSDFNLAPVLTHFEERGFSKSEYKGATVYSHAIDDSATGANGWARQNPAVANTAILANEKVLVLSGKLEAVHITLDAYRAEEGDAGSIESVRATVDRLGQVASAIIRWGTQACPRPDPTWASSHPGLAVGLSEKIAKKTHGYTALGVGYRYVGNYPLGLVVMHYDDSKSAQEDLQARRTAATDGVSVAAGSGRMPYSKVLFIVEDTAVEHSDLVMKLRPAYDRPQRLFDMVFQEDIAFTACP